jgi:hypothetical protein
VEIERERLGKGHGRGEESKDTRADRRQALHLDCCVAFAIEISVVVPLPLYVRSCPTVSFSPVVHLRIHAKTQTNDAQTCQQNMQQSDNS